MCANSDSFEATRTIGMVWNTGACPDACEVRAPSRGPCLRTGRRHHPLDGKASGGDNWAALVVQYFVVGQCVFNVLAHRIDTGTETLAGLRL